MSLLNDIGNSLGTHLSSILAPLATCKKIIPKVKQRSRLIGMRENFVRARTDPFASKTRRGETATC